MSKKSGGQLTPTPDRKSGSKAHKGGYGSLMESKSPGRPNPRNFGPGHASKGGVGQGGSGSARKGKRGK